MKKAVLLFFCTFVLYACENKTDENTQLIRASDNITQTEKGIILCDISDEPISKIERFQPLADYISNQLTEEGYTFGEVRVAPDIDQLSAWFAEGKVDIFMDSSSNIIQIINNSGAELVLKRWKNGVETYHSVIFTNTETIIESLDDLKGSLLAFEDYSSTTGYMLPMGHLLLNNYEMEEHELSSEVVSGDKIGWIFAGEDQNIVQWVLSGQAKAGVLSSSDYEELPESISEKLRIIERTPKVIRQFVVLRKDLDKSVKDSLISILTDMDKTEEGLLVLEHIKNTSKFEKLENGIQNIDYQYIKSVYEAVY